MTKPSTRQIRLEPISAAYWRVTFDHPPLNIFGPETIPQLEAIVAALERDRDVKVVVFDSMVEGFFLTHYDFLAKLEDGQLGAPTKSNGRAAAGNAERSHAGIGR
jgi:enoyl-CoA hydratase/carnithine racemase